MCGVRELCDCDLPIDGASFWSSVQELIDACQLYSLSYHPLHLSCRTVIYLLVLRKITVVCQPGHSDRENYLEQLLTEVEGWK